MFWFVSEFTIRQWSSSLLCPAYPRLRESTFSYQIRLLQKGKHGMSEFNATETLLNTWCTRSIWQVNCTIALLKKGLVCKKVRVNFQCKPHCKLVCNHWVEHTLQVRSFQSLVLCYLLFVCHKVKFGLALYVQFLTTCEKKAFSYQLRLLQIVEHTLSRFQATENICNTEGTQIIWQCIGTIALLRRETLFKRPGFLADANHHWDRLCSQSRI